MSMFRPRLRIPRLGQLARPGAQAQAQQDQFLLVRRRLQPLQQRFNQHDATGPKIPELPKELQNCTVDGIGTAGEGGSVFLSAGGVEVAWTLYMSLCIGKLKKLTNGTALQNVTDLKSVVFKTARDPMLAPIFNYASMAHNTHLFFQSLSHEPTKIPEGLEKGLVEAFGSIETLRREFLVTALAMFGPGFVWLVRTRSKQYSEFTYRLVPTYLAGSPYSRAHYRRQTTDMNTVSSDGPEARGPVTGWLEKQAGITAYKAPSVPGAQGDPSAATGPDPGVGTPALGGAVDVVPILCLNTWEHNWLPDYSILTMDGRESKRVYVETWWNHINWKEVESRLPERLDMKW